MRKKHIELIHRYIQVWSNLESYRSKGKPFTSSEEYLAKKIQWLYDEINQPNSIKSKTEEIGNQVLIANLEKEKIKFELNDESLESLYALLKNMTNSIESMANELEISMKDSEILRSEVENWPLLNRPNEMIWLIIGYLVFVYAGQRIMANKKPFDLKYPLLFHNLLCCLISLYITVESGFQAYINNYSLVCNPVDYSDKGIGFLHVYHHSSIFFLWWIGVNWTAGGDAYFSAMINSFIHTIMYGYYFMAALKINCPWKRYLTQLQLLQFVINVGSSVYALYYNCEFPRWMMYAMILYMFSMLALFGSFYFHAYINKKRNPRSKITKKID
eukprot:gene9160-11226_t